VLTERELLGYFEGIHGVLSQSASEFARALNDFSATLSLRLNLLREARRQMNVYLALDFNVFSYIEPDECRLSDMIAELLSPRGLHGQGDVFLRLFAQQLGCDPWPSPCPEVRREEPITYPVGSSGRLDIIVDFGSFGIGIENKPWAGEQSDQLHRYRAYLEQRYSGKFCLVYLSGSGTAPTSLPPEDREMLEAKRKFRTLSYRSGLRKWLHACETECKAEKIRWLLRDFDEFVSAKFKLDDLDGELSDVTR
jgi:hypothetical protein